DRLAVLDGNHPTGGERESVSGAVDLVDDRLPWAAGAQEVRMQRVHTALAGHRPAGGDQGLCGDLATEHADGRHLGGHAAVEVVVDSFQIQKSDQGVHHGLATGDAVTVEGHARGVVNQVTHAA